MATVTATIVFDSMEEAASFFAGKATKSTKTQAPQTANVAQTALPTGTSAASSAAEPAKQQEGDASAAATQSSGGPLATHATDLPGAQDRARQTYQAYVARGGGRTAETGKAFMTELGITTGIRNCTDAAALNALADKFIAS